MQVSIFALNLWRHATYARNGMQVISYLHELADFIEFYLHTRYNMTANANVYWPYFVPKTYDDIAKYDKTTLNPSFGQDMQIYLGYGLDLRPNDQDYSGYCACAVFNSDGTRRPGDMLYVDMPVFDVGPFAVSLYHFYERTCRIVTHEIDHEMLKKAGLPRSIHYDGVHKASKMPIERWLRGTAYNSHDEPVTSHWLIETGMFGLLNKPSYFVSQQDARLI